MASFNKCILMGNLTRDPELRFTQNNTALCKFTIAVDSGWGDKKETAFVDCTMWGKRAEAFERFHSKGSTALVEGEIKQDTWEDKNTGAKRSKLTVTVSDWSFAGKKEEREPAQSSSGFLEDDDNPFG